MSTTSYSIMVLPFSDEREDPFDLGFGVFTWCGRLQDLVDDSTEFWERALGETVWRRANAKKQLVFAATASDVEGDAPTPKGKLNAAWLALLLTSRVRPIGKAQAIDGTIYTVSGEVASEGSTPNPKTLRLRKPHTVSQKPALPRPFYVRGSSRYAKAFNESHQWNEADAQFPEDWRASLGVLVEAGRLPLLLRVALTAFEKAFFEDRLDFRLPLFIRAADAILGVPTGSQLAKLRRSGITTAESAAQEFALRALRVVPSLTQHWYVGGNERSVLDLAEQAYGHRSECAHGDLPFPEAYDDATQDSAIYAACRAEYLSEAVARTALRTALGHAQRGDVFIDRQTLKAAWADGTFPG